MRGEGSGRERTGSPEEGGWQRYCERDRRRLEGGGEGAPGEGRPGMRGEDPGACGGAGEGGLSREGRAGGGSGGGKKGERCLG